MNTKTYTIIYKSISDYKKKYYNDVHNKERCTIYETKTLRWSDLLPPLSLSA